jgi:hypothetical protein
MARKVRCSNHIPHISPERKCGRKFQFATGDHVTLTGNCDASWFEEAIVCAALRKFLPRTIAAIIYCKTAPFYLPVYVLLLHKPGFLEYQCILGDASAWLFLGHFFAHLCHVQLSPL